MPVRAVCKPHSPDLKRGALATDARGCSLWRSLLERPPPAPESRVQTHSVSGCGPVSGGGYKCNRYKMTERTDRESDAVVQGPFLGFYWG